MGFDRLQLISLVWINRGSFNERESGSGYAGFVGHFASSLVSSRCSLRWWSHNRQKANRQFNRAVIKARQASHDNQSQTKWMHLSLLGRG